MINIDGPVTGPVALTVGSTAVEAKAGASKQADRKGIVIQPVNGNIYFGFDNTVTTTTGFRINTGNIYRIDASGKFLDIYLISSGNVDVRILEFA